MLRQGIELIVGALVYLYAFFFAPKVLKSELISAAVGVFLTLLVDVLYKAYKERHMLGLRWQVFNPFFCRWNRDIRLSIAYLCRIEVNGRYLLIRNQRGQNGYQPVGGVYKYFYPELRDRFVKLEVITDSSIQNDDKSEFDLRVKLKRRRKLFDFLRWFNSGNNREIGPWREFYEELVEPGFLSKENFPYLFFCLVAHNMQKITYSEYFKIDEFLYADIFVPRLVSEMQKDELRGLMDKADNNFIFVTLDEIQRGTTYDGKVILPHTKKIV